MLLCVYRLEYTAKQCNEGPEWPIQRNTFTIQVLFTSVGNIKRAPGGALVMQLILPGRDVANISQIRSLYVSGCSSRVLDTRPRLGVGPQFADLPSALRRPGPGGGYSTTTFLQRLAGSYLKSPHDESNAAR